MWEVTTECNQLIKILFVKLFLFSGGLFFAKICKRKLWRTLISSFIYGESRRELHMFCSLSCFCVWGGSLALNLSTRTTLSSYNRNHFLLAQTGDCFVMLKYVRKIDIVIIPYCFAIKTINAWFPMEGVKHEEFEKNVMWWWSYFSSCSFGF